MTSKARIEYDLVCDGPKIAILRERGSRREVIQWGALSVKVIEEADHATVAPDESWLYLPEDDARALYEALTDYFGHGGHDTRALRKDYDAERARVDRLLTWVTQP